MLFPVPTTSGTVILPHIVSFTAEPAKVVRPSETAKSWLACCTDVTGRIHELKLNEDGKVPVMTEQEALGVVAQVVDQISRMLAAAMSDGMQEATTGSGLVVPQSGLVVPG